MKNLNLNSLIGIGNVIETVLSPMHNQHVVEVSKISILDDKHEENLPSKLKKVSRITVPFDGWFLEGGGGGGGYEPPTPQNPNDPSYNPIFDKNITGFTTNGGNWIVNKSLIYDFLTNSGLSAITETKRVKIERQIGYNPGRIFIDYKNVTEELPTNMVVPWDKGSGEAYYKYNAKIPWADIESFAKIHNMDIDNIKIKNITLIPELEVTNSPLYLAQINIPEFEARIGGRRVGWENQGITKNLTIDDRYKESEWTVSDILGAIITATGVVSSFTPLSFAQHFVKFKDIINKFENAKDVVGLVEGVRTINGLVSNGKKENYIHSMDNKNSIIININQKVNRNEDFSLSIKKLNFHGERHGNWWFEKTEAKINKMYMKIDFE